MRYFPRLFSGAHPVYTSGIEDGRNSARKAANALPHRPERRIPASGQEKLMFFTEPPAYAAPAQQSFPFEEAIGIITSASLRALSTPEPAALRAAYLFFAATRADSASPRPCL